MKLRSPQILLGGLFLAVLLVGCASAQEQEQNYEPMMDEGSMLDSSEEEEAEYEEEGGAAASASASGVSASVPGASASASGGSVGAVAGVGHDPMVEASAGTDMTAVEASAMKSNTTESDRKHKNKGHHMPSMKEAYLGFSMVKHFFEIIFATGKAIVETKHLALKSVLTLITVIQFLLELKNLLAAKSAPHPPPGPLSFFSSLMGGPGGPYYDRVDSTPSPLKHQPNSYLPPTNWGKSDKLPVRYTNYKTSTSTGTKYPDYATSSAYSSKYYTNTSPYRYLHKSSSEYYQPSGTSYTSRSESSPTDQWSSTSSTSYNSQSSQKVNKQGSMSNHKTEADWSSADPTAYSDSASSSALHS